MILARLVVNGTIIVRLIQHTNLSGSGLVFVDSA